MKTNINIRLIIVTYATVLAAVSPAAQAQLPSPTPDGGYPNFNTAEGDNALFSLTTGSENTANGFGALFSNTTGFQNTANGLEALFSNTAGNDNTANGAFALQANTTGSNNTANGFGALFANTTGANNTATGVSALEINVAGNNNVANGVNALLNNTTINGVSGSNNTANGANALSNNTTGKRNIALGFNAGSKLTIGNDNIEIGNIGGAGESATIRIGVQGTQKATFIAGISGATIASGATVIVSSAGHLGTTTSSERFKEAIKPMNKASEAILALKPVTFRYKHELDPEGIPQFGLVAEQVEKVNPDLVVRGADGKINTVRYEAVNAMLLNEFLKEHRRVEEQKATVVQMRSTVAKQEALIAKQQKQIDSLTAGLQKVSDRLELSKPAPQIVADNQ